MRALARFANRISAWRAVPVADGLDDFLRAQECFGNGISQNLSKIVSGNTQAWRMAYKTRTGPKRGMEHFINIGTRVRTVQPHMRCQHRASCFYELSGTLVTWGNLESPSRHRISGGCNERLRALALRWFEGFALRKQMLAWSAELRQLDFILLSIMIDANTKLPVIHHPQVTPDGSKTNRIRFVGATLCSLYKGVLYFLSFSGPVAVIHHYRSLPVAVLLVFAIVGYGFAGVLFLALLVLTRKVLVGSISCTGSTTLDNEDAKKWFAGAMLMSILVDSPFRPMTTGLSLFASPFYRGMGAAMPYSVLLGVRSRITDPWFVELGEKVTIGGDAVILGHLGHGDQIMLGRVIIGDGSIVGAKAVVFPDVRIGRRARIGAGAVVVRGTIVGDGETWAGVPARKISTRREKTGLARAANNGA